MAIPQKPINKVDGFIENAKAEKTPEPKTQQLNVLLPYNFHKAIKENSNGNMKYFTMQVFGEYFERNGIKVKE